MKLREGRYIEGAMLKVRAFQSLLCCDYLNVSASIIKYTKNDKLSI